jgi:hypothetical protein
MLFRELLIQWKRKDFRKTLDTLSSWRSELAREQWSPLVQCRCVCIAGPISFQFNSLVQCNPSWIESICSNLKKCGLQHVFCFKKMQLNNVGLYRGVLTFGDQFTALGFMVTGAPPPSKCIRILLLN